MAMEQSFESKHAFTGRMQGRGSSGIGETLPVPGGVVSLQVLAGRHGSRRSSMDALQALLYLQNAYPGVLTRRFVCQPRAVWVASGASRPFRFSGVGTTCVDVLST